MLERRGMDYLASLYEGRRSNVHRIVLNGNVTNFFSYHVPNQRFLNTQQYALSDSGSAQTHRINSMELSLAIAP